MDLAVNQSRFLDGLASAADVDRDLLDRPGTTVIGREDRAGSGAVACYRVGAHLVALADPAVVDRVENLASAETRSEADVVDRHDQAGFGLHASLINNMLTRPTTAPPPVPEGYTQLWLDGEQPTTLEAVQAFTTRCDPDEVDAAGLDEIDDEFVEAAINVLVAEPAREASDMVAYASASPWEWDATLADVGVLVDAANRRRGLAHLVVAHTVDRLLADGRVPLYRHLVTNAGSAAVAAGNGFAPVARLDYFTVKAEDRTSNG